MSDWIEVKSEELLKPHSTKLRGVELNVLVSPHDIPQQIRGHYDKDHNRFVIEFRYLIDEKPARFPLLSDDKAVKFISGENSGRLLSIEVDTQKVVPQVVKLNIGVTEPYVEAAEDRLKQLSATESRLSRRLNYEAAWGALEESKTQLAIAH